MARAGVAPGDRVLIATRNRAEHVLAYWALQTIGGVPTPVNHRLSGAELAYLLGDSGARVVLFERTTADRVLEAARDRTALLVCADDDAPRGTIPLAELATPGRGAKAPPPAEADLSLIL